MREGSRNRLSLRHYEQEVEIRQRTPLPQRGGGGEQVGETVSASEAVADRSACPLASDQGSEGGPPHWCVTLSAERVSLHCLPFRSCPHFLPSVPLCFHHTLPLTVCRSVLPQTPSCSPDSTRTQPCTHLGPRLLPLSPEAHFFLLSPQPDRAPALRPGLLSQVTWCLDFHGDLWTPLCMALS